MNVWPDCPGCGHKPGAHYSDCPVLSQPMPPQKLTFDGIVKAQKGWERDRIARLHEERSHEMRLVVVKELMRDCIKRGEHIDETNIQRWIASIANDLVDEIYPPPKEGP